MFKLFLKKWIFLLVIIIFNFIIAIGTSISLFYFIFWFLMSLTAISLTGLIIEYFLARLYFVRKVTDKIQLGDNLEVFTEARNNSCFPIFNLVFEDCLACAPSEEKIKRSILPYMQKGFIRNLSYGCFCSKRGKYKIGPLAVYFFDPLGLFFLKKVYPIFSEVYVLPEMFNISKFPALKKGSFPWFGLESGRFSGEDNEFFGIREYKEGDPVKMIHWFSVAKKNMLIVKEFERQGFSRATLMFNLHKDLNFGEGRENISEYIISICASIAKYLTEKEIPLEIIAHAGEIVRIPANKGARHLEDILKFLAAAQAESQVSLREVFEEFLRHIPDDSNLIIVMAERDWELLQAAFSLEKRNIALIPLILISSGFSYSGDAKGAGKDARIKLSQAFNFNPIIFSRGDNPEEVFMRY